MPPASSVSDEESAARAGGDAYQEYLAERDEILRHKWHLSERAGRDVGWEHALVDWARHHRAEWRRQK